MHAQGDNTMGVNASIGNIAASTIPNLSESASMAEMAATAISVAGLMAPGTDRQCALAPGFGMVGIAVNPSHADMDHDGIGDACDPDEDGDGIPNASDNCAKVWNPTQADADHNGKGDACDDRDGDGIIDIDDNCPDKVNPDQADTDGDGFGNVCEPAGYDADGIPDVSDDCPFKSNPDQKDSDHDGLGDACDPCPNGVDVVTSWTSGSPGVAPQPVLLDSDGDGVPDGCDSTPFGYYKLDTGYLLGLGKKSALTATVDVNQPVLVAIDPCPAGGCTQFSEATRITLALAGSTAGLHVAVIDDRGKHVATLKTGSLRFAPRGGRTYRLAIGADKRTAVSLVVSSTGGESTR
jgi:hypothetical protein